MNILCNILFPYKLLHIINSRCPSWLDHHCGLNSVWSWNSREMEGQEFKKKASYWIVQTLGKLQRATINGLFVTAIPMTKIGKLTYNHAYCSQTVCGGILGHYKRSIGYINFWENYNDFCQKPCIKPLLSCLDLRYFCYKFLFAKKNHEKVIKMLKVLWIEKIQYEKDNKK